MSSSNCSFLTCIQVSQEAGEVVWDSHLFQNFPQFLVIHTVKGFGIVNKAEIDVFLELSCFFNDIIFLYGLWILIYRLDLSMISYLLLSHHCVKFFATQWTAAYQPSLSSTVSQSLLKLMFFESMMPSNHLILCHLLLLLPSFSPASESFPMSQLFSSGDQSIGASASVLPVNIQGWFPLGLTSLILQSKVLSRVFPSTTIWKLQLFSAQPSLWKNSPFWFLFIFLFPVLFLPFTLYMHPLFLVLALFSWPPCGTSF